MRPLSYPLRLAASALTALMLTAPAYAAAKDSPVQANVKDGVDAWEKGDNQQAVAIWRPLALAGNPDAQFNLGQAYKLGRGVPADLGQAEAWYRRAADQGHLQAEDNLGLVLFTANRREEAMPMITRSAQRGEPRAQYVLGTAHFNGDLATQNWPLAYALTKRASDAGLSIASARLAQLDQLIPLEQRQAGLAMLPEMERNEQRARLAAVNAAAPPPPKPAKSNVRTASLPQSLPGTSYVPPPVIKPGSKAPVLSPAPSVAQKVPQPIPSAALPASSAGTDYVAPEGLEELPPTANIPVSTPAQVVVHSAPPPPKTAPAPAPAKPAPVSTASASKWRAQLGAFSVETNARNLWSSLEKQYPAFANRQPYLVKSGKLTRLQAGGFANKGAADNFCATVRKGGQACMVIDK